jgi:hypothetical protein
VSPRVQRTIEEALQSLPKEPSMSVSSRFSRRALGITVLALATAWSSPAPLRAQGERITLPRKPGPNQTLVVHLTQDMDMQMSVPAANADTGAATGADAATPPRATPPPQSMPPMKITGNMMMEATQKVGEVDDQGRTPCEMTYTDANVDMKMNGMAMPNQDFKDQFVGKAMTFAYAQDGSVTDVKMPENSPQTAGIRAAVQQGLSAFTISLPTQPLAVGESASMPFSVPLALPLPGGATPPSFKGTITYTLVRIDGAGRDRVAVLDQKMDATAQGALPAPGGGAAGAPATGPNLTMHMTGTGQVQVDLARGIAREGDIQTTMDGTIKRGEGPSQPGVPANIRLQGTTRMKMSAKPDDR